MQITDDVDDQLMCVMAFRYCLGRRTYIVSSCLDWLRKHWEMFLWKTKFIMLRDTVEALHDGYAGHKCDEDGWREFLRWGIGSLNSEQVMLVRRAVEHKCELEDVL